MLRPRVEQNFFTDALVKALKNNYSLRRYWYSEENIYDVDGERIENLGVTMNQSGEERCVSSCEGLQRAELCVRKLCIMAWSISGMTECWSDDLRIAC
jgi:hypothetical protein